MMPFKIMLVKHFKIFDGCFIIVHKSEYSSVGFLYQCKERVNLELAQLRYSLFEICWTFPKSNFSCLLQCLVNLIFLVGFMGFFVSMFGNIWFIYMSVITMFIFFHFKGPSTLIINKNCKKLLVTNLPTPKLLWNVA